MNATDSNNDQGSDPAPSGLRRPLLRRVEQTSIAALTALSLAAIAVSLYVQSRHGGGLIEVDDVAPVEIEFKIDINHADWPELALLPNIGEAMARRIVESRQQQGPFRSLDEIKRVRGIGPKTLERLRPYLLPIAEADAVVANPAGK